MGAIMVCECEFGDDFVRGKGEGESSEINHSKPFGRKMILTQYLRLLFQQ